jgi:hypothetical protein
MRFHMVLRHDRRSLLTGSYMLVRIYATGRKVAGSNPDEVDFFNLSDPSSHTMASTQPLTEMSTRNILGGKGRPARKANNLTHLLWADCLENVGTSKSHNPMGLHGLLQGYFYFTFYFMIAFIFYTCCTYMRVSSRVRRFARQAQRILAEFCMQGM